MARKPARFPIVKTGSRAGERAARTPRLAGSSGSLSGYNVAFRGRAGDPRRPRTWSLPDGRRVQCDDESAFSEIANHFSLDSIASIAAAMTMQRESNPVAFTKRLANAGITAIDAFQPFALRRIVTRAIVERDLPDSVTRQIDPVWLLRLEDAMAGIVSAADANRLDSGDSDTTSMSMRILQSQYPDQCSPADFARELQINSEGIALAASDGVDLEQLYRDRFGISFRELEFLSFAAWASLIGEGTTGVLDPCTWISSGAGLAVRPGAVEAFFDTCGASYARIQAEARQQPLRIPGLEPYMFSPLLRWPLVQRSDGTYVAPVARGVLDRPNRGFHLDSRKAVNEAARGVLGNAIGQAYAEYVLRCLARGRPGTGTVIDADTMFPADILHCDYVCLEGSGGNTRRS